jgi:hypothetical protein
LFLVIGSPKACLRKWVMVVLPYVSMFSCSTLCHQCIPLLPYHVSFSCVIEIRLMTKSTFSQKNKISYDYKLIYKSKKIKGMHMLTKLNYHIREDPIFLNFYKKLICRKVEETFIPSFLIKKTLFQLES